MASLAYQTDFFHFVAPRQNTNTAQQDPMESAILACQKKDASILQNVFRSIRTFLTTYEDHADDRIESAILACQRKDAQVVRHFLGGDHA